MVYQWWMVNVISMVDIANGISMMGVWYMYFNGGQPMVCEWRVYGMSMVDSQWYDNGGCMVFQW